jgi:hypothetical protein
MHVSGELDENASCIDGKTDVPKYFKLKTGNTETRS